MPKAYTKTRYLGQPLRYYLGGVPRDYKQALRWLRKAAEQGDAEAQSCLGLMYIEGDGVKRDYEQAARWYRKAAEQNHADAQLRLGGMYMLGKGMQKDDIAAYKWLGLATAQGKEKAREWLEMLEKSMSPEDIAKVQKSATKWHGEH